MLNLKLLFNLNLSFKFLKDLVLAFKNLIYDKSLIVNYVIDVNVFNIKVKEQLHLSSSIIINLLDDKLLKTYKSYLNIYTFIAIVFKAKDENLP